MISCPMILTESQVELDVKYFGRVHNISDGY